MIKIVFFIFSLIVLSNCSTPGSALLGPIFTGATTQSVAQTSLSYSTGKVSKKIHSSLQKKVNLKNSLLKN